MTVIIDTNGITAPTANITNTINANAANITSTITANTMVDATGNTIPASTLVKGVAKAWGNYNATTATINGSFNVSSITVNGTGDYTINFTTALANANYSIVGTAGAYLTSDNPRVFGTLGGGTYTTTACRVIVVLTSGGGNTRDVVNFVVFGT